MQLLKEYFSLCFFKNNPLDLHPSSRFVWKNFAFYIAIGILVESNISDPVDGTIEIITETILTLLLIGILLMATKKYSLFVQLFTALITCENFILFLGVLTEFLDEFLRKTPYEDIPLVLGGLLAIWFVLIVAYILRQMFFFNKTKSILLGAFYAVFTVVGAFLLTEVI
jgi:hypothetical protein